MDKHRRVLFTDLYGLPIPLQTAILLLLVRLCCMRCCQEHRQACNPHAPAVVDLSLTTMLWCWKDSCGAFWPHSSCQLSDLLPLSRSVLCFHILSSEPFLDKPNDVSKQQNNGNIQSCDRLSLLLRAYILSIHVGLALFGLALLRNTVWSLDGLLYAFRLAWSYSWPHQLHRLSAKTNKRKSKHVLACIGSDMGHVCCHYLHWSALLASDYDRSSSMDGNLKCLWRETSKRSRYGFIFLWRETSSLYACRRT